MDSPYNWPIRIEDEFIVTEYGAELLSHVPRTVREIEDFMAGRDTVHKYLQRFRVKHEWRSDNITASCIEGTWGKAIILCDHNPFSNWFIDISPPAPLLQPAWHPEAQQGKFFFSLTFYSFIQIVVQNNPNRFCLEWVEGLKITKTNNIS